MKGSAPNAASNLSFGHAGLRQGGLCGYSNKSIEPRVQFLDSSQTVYSQVDRGKRASAEQFADLPDGLLQWFTSSCENIIVSCCSCPKSVPVNSVCENT